MRRTQIYLDEKLYYFLKEESKKTGKTISEIIRNRLRNSFKENNRKEMLIRALNEAFGAWREKDIDPESFVRELRRGKRIDSFGY